MKDFEDQLREIELRKPAPEWADDLYAQCTFTERLPESAGWKSWLWPSPLAWAAMAVIWIGLSALDQADRPPGSAVASTSTPLPTRFLVLERTEPSTDPFWVFVDLNRL